MISFAQSAEPTPRDQLRFIVQQQCLPHWLTAHDPAPCITVHLPDDNPAADGFALLADRKGGAHLLVIPTRTLGGIESPEASRAGTTNYFDAGWRVRSALQAFTGHAVARRFIGMAVNQVRARSQDQLHIHLSCLGKTAYDTLQRESESLIPDRWSVLSVADRPYYAIRINGAELGETNPVGLLANELVGAPALMAEFTLLVAGMEFRQGPGFVILAGSAVPGSERLLDPTCALAGQAAQ